MLTNLSNAVPCDSLTRVWPHPGTREKAPAGNGPRVPENQRKIGISYRNWGLAHLDQVYQPGQN